MKGLSKGRYDETFAGEDDNLRICEFQSYKQVRNKTCRCILILL